MLLLLLYGLRETFKCIPAISFPPSLVRCRKHACELNKTDGRNNNIISGWYIKHVFMRIGCCCHAIIIIIRRRRWKHKNIIRMLTQRDFSVMGAYYIICVQPSTLYLRNIQRTYARSRFYGCFVSSFWLENLQLSQCWRFSDGFHYFLIDHRPSALTATTILFTGLKRQSKKEHKHACV